jgi:hypothetical protein
MTIEWTQEAQIFMKCFNIEEIDLQQIVQHSENDIKEIVKYSNINNLYKNELVSFFNELKNDLKNSSWNVFPDSNDSPNSQLKNCLDKILNQIDVSSSHFIMPQFNKNVIYMQTVSKEYKSIKNSDYLSFSNDLEDFVYDASKNLFSILDKSKIVFPECFVQELLDMQNLNQNKNQFDFTHIHYLMSLIIFNNNDKVNIDFANEILYNLTNRFLIYHIVKQYVSIKNMDIVSQDKFFSLQKFRRNLSKTKTLDTYLNEQKTLKKHQIYPFSMTIVIDFIVSLMFWTRYFKWPQIYYCMDELKQENLVQGNFVLNFFQENFVYVFLKQYIYYLTIFGIFCAFQTMNFSQITLSIFIVYSVFHFFNIKYN